MSSQQREGQKREVENFETERAYKCPDCGGQAHFMGLDFKAPKKSDTKAWREVEGFIRSGKVFYRGSQR